jgi:uncharacterized membrane protein YphA (DoxX/SURF4 family)
MVSIETLHLLHTRPSRQARAMNAASNAAPLPAPALLHPLVFAAGGVAGAALAVPLPVPVAALALLAVALRLGVMFASTGR